MATSGDRRTTTAILCLSTVLTAVAAVSVHNGIGNNGLAVHNQPVLENVRASLSDLQTYQEKRKRKIQGLRGRNNVIFTDTVVKENEDKLRPPGLTDDIGAENEVGKQYSFLQIELEPSRVKRSPKINLVQRKIRMRRKKLARKKRLKKKKARMMRLANRMKKRAKTKKYLEKKANRTKLRKEQEEEEDESDSDSDDSDEDSDDSDEDSDEDDDDDYDDDDDDDDDDSKIGSVDYEDFEESPENKTAVKEKIRKYTSVKQGPVFDEDYEDDGSESEDSDTSSDDSDTSIDHSNISSDDDDDDDDEDDDDEDDDDDEEGDEDIEYEDEGSEEAKKVTDGKTKSGKKLKSKSKKTKSKKTRKIKLTGKNKIEKQSGQKIHELVDNVSKTQALMNENLQNFDKTLHIILKSSESTRNNAELLAHKSAHSNAGTLTHEVNSADKAHDSIHNKAQILAYKVKSSADKVHESAHNNAQILVHQVKSVDSADESIHNGAQIVAHKVKNADQLHAPAYNKVEVMPNKVNSADNVHESTHNNEQIHQVNSVHTADESKHNDAQVVAHKVKNADQVHESAHNKVEVLAHKVNTAGNVHESAHKNAQILVHQVNSVDSSHEFTHNDAQIVAHKVNSADKAHESTHNKVEMLAHKVNGFDKTHESRHNDAQILAHKVNNADKAHEFTYNKVEMLAHKMKGFDNAHESLHNDAQILAHKVNNADKAHESTHNNAEILAHKLNSADKSNKSTRDSNAQILANNMNSADEIHLLSELQDTNREDSTKLFISVDRDTNQVFHIEGDNKAQTISHVLNGINKNHETEHHPVRRQDASKHVDISDPVVNHGVEMHSLPPKQTVHTHSDRQDVASSHRNDFKTHTSDSHALKADKLIPVHTLAEIHHAIQQGVPRHLENKNQKPHNIHEHPDIKNPNTTYEPHPASGGLDKQHTTDDEQHQTLIHQGHHNILNEAINKQVFNHGAHSENTKADMGSINHNYEHVEQVLFDVVSGLDHTDHNRNVMDHHTANQGHPEMKQTVDLKQVLTGQRKANGFADLSKEHVKPDLLSVDDKTIGEMMTVNSQRDQRVRSDMKSLGLKQQSLTADITKEHENNNEHINNDVLVQNKEHRRPIVK